MENIRIVPVNQAELELFLLICSNVVRCSAATWRSSLSMRCVDVSLLKKSEMTQFDNLSASPPNHTCSDGGTPCARLGGAQSGAPCHFTRFIPPLRPESQLRRPFEARRAGT